MGLFLKPVLHLHDTFPNKRFFPSFDSFLRRYSWLFFAFLNPPPPPLYPSHSSFSFFLSKIEGVLLPPSTLHSAYLFNGAQFLRNWLGNMSLIPKSKIGPVFRRKTLTSPCQQPWLTPPPLPSSLPPCLPPTFEVTWGYIRLHSDRLC